MVSLLVFWGESGFQPNKLDVALVGLVDYWEHIADQAVQFFNGKTFFMNWVCANYFDDEHRRMADGCWDLACIKIWVDEDDS